MRESIQIKINDPVLPWFSVRVVGKVEKFVYIQPERVHMEGPAGRRLFAEVAIIPRPDHPFRIGQVRVKNGTFIKYELTQRCADGKNRCVIRVENTRKEKGRYIDALLVETDSKIKPVIPIYVMGTIR
jgi:hypothetical protein